MALSKLKDAVVGFVLQRIKSCMDKNMVIMHFYAYNRIFASY